MLNIPELEKRWLQYKIRSYAPYIAFSLVFIIVVMVLWLYPTNKQETTIEIDKPIKQAISNAEAIEEKKVNLPPQKKYKKEEQTILKPSMNFISQIHDTPDIAPKRVYVKPKEKFKTTLTKTIPPKVIVKEVKKDIKPDIQTETKTDTIITIKTKETSKDIQEIIKRFQKNHNPALSLFVAKKYYELGFYKKAYNYALITNKLNNDIEGSWIIFAKSLVKLNKKDMAISTLEKYIEYSDSTTAQILLNDIRSGKFR